MSMLEIKVYDQSGRLVSQNAIHTYLALLQVNRLMPYCEPDTHTVVAAIDGHESLLIDAPDWIESQYRQYNNETFFNDYIDGTDDTPKMHERLLTQWYVYAAVFGSGLGFGFIL